MLGILNLYKWFCVVFCEVKTAFIIIVHNFFSFYWASLRHCTKIYFVKLEREKEKAKRRRRRWTKTKQIDFNEQTKTDHIKSNSQQFFLLSLTQMAKRIFGSNLTRICGEKISIEFTYISMKSTEDLNYIVSLSALSYLSHIFANGWKIV